MLIAGRAGPERQIDLRQHAFGLAVVWSMTAERGPDGVGRQRAGDSLLGSPTDRRGQQTVGQAEPIVERPADLIGLGRPAGQVPAVQQRRDRRQSAALQPVGGGDLFLQFGSVDRRPQEHFAFQVGRQPAGDHFQDVRFAVVEVAFLVGEHPERAQQGGGGGDRHAHGGGEILGRVPGGHQAIVVEDYGVAQQRFEIGHGPLQRPGGRGKSIERQSPGAAQFQLGGGLIEEIERRGVAADGFGARQQGRLQSFGQVLFFLAVRNRRHSGRQFGLAPAERVPRLEQLAEQVGDGGGQRFGGGARNDGEGRAEGGVRIWDFGFRICGFRIPDFDCPTASTAVLAVSPSPPLRLSASPPFCGAYCSVQPVAVWNARSNRGRHATASMGGRTGFGGCSV